MARGRIQARAAGGDLGVAVAVLGSEEHDAAVAPVENDEIINVSELYYILYFECAGVRE